MAEALIGSAVLGLLFWIFRKKGKPKISQSVKSESISEKSILEIKDTIRQAARRNGIREALALGLAEDESSFNSKAVNKAEDAIGLFQIRPIAFLEYLKGTGQNDEAGYPKRFNPEINAEAAMWYLAWLKKTIQKNLGRTPTDIELLEVYKGGIGNFLRRTVSAEARRLAQRAYEKVLTYG